MSSDLAQSEYTLTCDSGHYGQRALIGATSVAATIKQRASAGYCCDYSQYIGVTRMLGWSRACDIERMRGVHSIVTRSLGVHEVLGVHVWVCLAANEHYMLLYVIPPPTESRTGRDCCLCLHTEPHPFWSPSRCLWRVLMLGDFKGEVGTSSETCKED